MPKTPRHAELPAILQRLPGPLRDFAQLLADTAAGGGRHELALYAPAIAYSLVISLAPILVGLQMFGGGKLAEAVLSNSPLGSGEITASDVWGGALDWAGPHATVVTAMLVLFGASSLFNQIVSAISRIWQQPGGLEGMRRFVRQRAFAVLLVIVAGAALLASAVAGGVVGLVVTQLEKAAAGVGVELGWLATLLNNRFWLDLGFAWLLFTTAFTAVPRVRPKARDIAFGAFITSAAYAAGQKVLSFYFDSASRFSALGSFGGFLALLVWAYYTAVIVLWGAELTHQLALRRQWARAQAAAESQA